MRPVIGGLGNVKSSVENVFGTPPGDVDFVFDERIEPPPENVRSTVTSLLHNLFASAARNRLEISRDDESLGVKMRGFTMEKAVESGKVSCIQGFASCRLRNLRFLAGWGARITKQTKELAALPTVEVLITCATLAWLTRSSRMLLSLFWA